MTNLHEKIKSIDTSLTDQLDESKKDLSTNEKIRKYFIALGNYEKNKLKENESVSWQFIYTKIHNEIKKGTISIVKFKKEVESLSGDDAPLYVWDNDKNCYTDDLSVLKRNVLHAFHSPISEGNEKNIIHNLSVNADVIEENKNIIRFTDGYGLFENDNMTFTPFSEYNKKFCPIKETACRSFAWGNTDNPPQLFLDDGTPFNFDDWLMTTVAGNDEEIYKLMWQCLGCLTTWENSMMFLLHSDQNNTGKGTFLSLCENYVKGSPVSRVRLGYFEDEKQNRSLYQTRFCLGDEVPKNISITNKECAVIKTIINGEGFDTHMMYKGVRHVEPLSVIIQTCNDIPRFFDSSLLNGKRMRVIPFNHSYTGETEKPEIKRRILKDKDLLSYICHTVVKNKLFNLDLYALENPRKSIELLENIEKDSNPLTDWYEDFKETNEFCTYKRRRLYNLFKLYNPHSKMGERTFCKEFIKIAHDDGWKNSGDNKVYQKEQGGNSKGFYNDRLKAQGYTVNFDNNKNALNRTLKIP